MINLRIVFYFLAFNREKISDTWIEKTIYSCLWLQELYRLFQNIYARNCKSNKAYPSWDLNEYYENSHHTWSHIKMPFF